LCHKFLRLMLRTAFTSLKGVTLFFVIVRCGAWLGLTPYLSLDQMF
jgi:hypothetical protein